LRVLGRTYRGKLGLVFDLGRWWKNGISDGGISGRHTNL
jgi:hypothetical protein